MWEIIMIGKISKNLFISTDFPSTPRYLFKFYSDETIKKLNENIFQMDEQIARALILHQLLGTRISDTLTLKTDCLSIRENRYFITNRAGKINHI